MSDVIGIGGEEGLHSDVINLYSPYWEMFIWCNCMYGLPR